MQTGNPYQIAIDKINEVGKYVAKPGQDPYRLLHKLSISLGTNMHGSRSFIGKTFNISKEKMQKKAKDALKQYCRIGVLQIPDEFKFSDYRSYRHDGNATANRNTWKQSNKAQEDKNKKQPITYTFNSLK